MSAKIEGNKLIIDLSSSEIIINNRLVTTSIKDDDQANIVIGPENMSFFGGFEKIEGFNCSFDEDAVLRYKQFLIGLPAICKALYRNDMADLESSFLAMRNRKMSHLISPDKTHRAIAFCRDENEDGTKDSDVIRKIFFDGISGLEIEKISNSELILRPFIKEDGEWLALFNKIIRLARVESGNNDVSLSKNCIDVTLNKRKDKTNPLNLIVYGAPGTSKTYNMPRYAYNIASGKKYDSAIDRVELMKNYNKMIQDGRIVFTTFHQNYGYEDFIQGLRPDPKSNSLSFKVMDGVFKKIADKALHDGGNNYVIIIDEINRANISKVFGELITLIEDDKRWGEESQMQVTLPSGDVFAVPNNLYIIGTMNSADKSISLIDAALRRRFSFEEMVPDSSLISDAKLKAIFEKMNLKLNEMLESSDLLIGHSYFIGKSVADFHDLMNKNIVPLLYEYFYDNKNKVSKFLDDVLKDTGYKVKDNKFGRLTIEKGN